MYDFLAGSENMESSYFLSKGKAIEHFPMLKANNLVGALVYYDGEARCSQMLGTSGLNRSSACRPAQ